MSHMNYCKLCSVFLFVVHIIHDQYDYRKPTFL